MEVKACSSAEEALELLQRGERFDAAVIDRVMPGMDGLELAARLREIPHAFEDAGDPADRDGPRGTSTPPSAKSATSARCRSRGNRSISSANCSACSAPMRPRVTAPLPPIEPQRVLEPSSAEEMPVRILVVEDNPTNLQVVLTVLQAARLLARCRRDGQAGIEMAEVGGYDLILLDVQLPDIDGWSVARAPAPICSRQGAHHRGDHGQRVGRQPPSAASIPAWTIS